MQLPTELPVMALPRCILFPQAMLPLRIFEERYRRMLADSLASHRMFCVGTIRRGAAGGDEDEKQGIYDILGVGLVRVAVGRQDGTSNLVLQGICRARVLELLEDQPYRRARLEPLSSFGGHDLHADALAAKVAELVAVRSKAGSKVPEHILKFLASLREPEAFCDLASFTLLEDCHAKQSVLELLDLRARFKKALELLQKEIQQLDLIQRLKEGAAADQTRLN